MVDQICRNCRFWHGPGSNYDGRAACHRFPPVAQDSGRSAAFPRPHGGDWCGEFKPVATDEEHRHG